MTGFVKELWRNLHVVGGGSDYLLTEMHWLRAPMLRPTLIAELERELGMSVEIELVGGPPAGDTVH